MCRLTAEKIPCIHFNGPRSKISEISFPDARHCVQLLEHFADPETHQFLSMRLKYQHQPQEGETWI